MDKVTQAIEKVFVQRPTPLRPYRATLRDLFDLDSDNGDPMKYSDLGAALMRLDAKTLGRLRGFLGEKEEEAGNRYGRGRCIGLYTTVSLAANMKSLSPDKPLFPDGQNTPLPFDAVAYYLSSGRPVNLATPILAAALAEALDQQRGYISDRRKAEIIEEKLGVPRTTLHDWFQRMEEVGMTWRKFTGAQLEYVALGKKRGRPPKEN